ncbi:hypothetical protein N6H14_02710 [Paenibacillus sp. CC-CFT747]|nr:hypothetical protein N6H14_02710 [Paenibacillus sp. CC-CFT747]
MTTSSRKRLPLYRFLDRAFGSHSIVPTPRLALLAALGSAALAAGYAAGLGMTVFWLYNGLLLLAGGSTLPCCRQEGSGQ